VWLGEYDLQFVDATICLTGLGTGTLQADLFLCFLTPEQNSDEQTAMLDLIKAQDDVPVLVIVGAEADVPSRNIFSDFLTLPLSRTSVLQRVQLGLSLKESEERNAAYKKHFKEKLDEIAKLERQAVEKEVLADEALIALQAPIVTVTKALVEVTTITRCFCGVFLIFLIGSSRSGNAQFSIEKHVGKFALFDDKEKCLSTGVAAGVIVRVMCFFFLKNNIRCCCLIWILWRNLFCKRISTTAKYLPQRHKVKH
jgi:hypothetical protein